MGCLGCRPRVRVGTYECGVTVSAQDDVADVTEFAALLRELKERTDRSYGSLARRLNMNTSTLHRYCAGEAVPVDFAPVERFAALCGASGAERLELHRRWLRAVRARRRPRGVDASAGAVAVSESATDSDSGSGRDAGSGPGSGSDAPSGPHAGEESADGPGTAHDRALAARTGGGPATRPGPHGRTITGARPVGGAPDAPGGPVTASDGEDGPTTGPGSAEGEGGPPSAPEVRGNVVSGPLAQEARGRGPWYRRRERVAVALAAACALLATVGSLSALPDGRRSSGERDSTAAPPSAPATTGPAAPRSRTSSPAPSGSASGSGSASASAQPKGSRGPTSPGPRRSPAAPAVPEESAPAGPPPLAWSVDSQVWAHGCGHDYVIAKPPKQVPPPPAPQDAGTWAATQSAVHGGETMVELSVQGTSDTAVVLTALRVRVAGRSDPAPGNAYAMDQGCGGALTPRYFDVDLDKDRPIARAVAGNDAGAPIPAVRMPYRVSATDPEVLLVTARTEGCDCRWYLELDWSSQGRTGTVRIDDDGRPFRTSGIEGLPRYEYDTSARGWRPRAQ